MNVDIDGVLFVIALICLIVGVIWSLGFLIVIAAALAVIGILLMITRNRHSRL